MSATAQRKTSTRDVASFILRDVFGTERRGAQASYDIRIRKADFDARDRAFVTEMAYGAIKMRRLLDWYLAPYLAARTQALPPAIAEILRLGIYQLRCMNGVEDHAAVFETVNLARRYGHSGTAGLVNAILRRFLADMPPAPQRAAFTSENDYLATAFSYPTWVVTQWSQRFGAARIEAILAGGNAAPQRALRVETGKASTEAVREILSEQGIITTPSLHVSDVLIASGAALAEDPQGRWVLQGESACMPVDILAPQPGERVIELCAGRGNKTLQIAARMRGQGALAIVEIDGKKVERLAERLEAADVPFAAVIEADARDFAPPSEPDADAVILDAPCTGLGVLGRHAEARWRKAKDDGARMAVVQRELIAHAATLLKVGGRLVYSVCSTDPRECEEVVDEFLSAQPGFARMDVPVRYAPFERAADIVVPPGIDGRDGFYIAVLQRQR